MRDNRVDPSDSDDWAIDGPAAEPLTAFGDDRPFPTKAGVLTKAEIEALLRPNLPPDLGKPEAPRAISPRPTPEFSDAPTAAAPDEALRRNASGLAARLTLSLSKSTGMKAAIHLAELQVLPRAALTDLMQGKTGAVACFGPDEHDIHSLVCLPGPFADALIARACGARGSSGRIGDGWALSAIDCALLEQLLAPVGLALGEAMRLQAIETDMPFVASLLPEGELMVCEYGVEAPGLHADMAVISLPSPVRAEAALRGEAVAKAPPVTALLTARIASLSVPLSRLTQLKAGSTLLLGVPPDQPVEILSGGRDGPVVFEGQVGRRGNKVAVRISRKTRALQS